MTSVVGIVATALWVGLGLSSAHPARAVAPQGPTKPADVPALPVWNAGDVREWKNLKTPAPSWAVAFSTDGKLLAAGGLSDGGVAPGWITFWDTATWKELRTIKLADARIRRLCFVPGQSLLVAGGWEASRLLVCDPKDGSSRTIYRSTEDLTHGDSPFVISPDGRFLLTSNPQDGASVWETKTWSKVQNIPGFRDHDVKLSVDPSEAWEFPRGNVYSLDGTGLPMRFYPNNIGPPLGAVLPTKPGICYAGPRVPVWGRERVRRPVRPWNFAETVSPAISQDGRSAALCVSDEDGSAHMEAYDVLPSKEWKRRFRVDLGRDKNVFCLAFSPDGRAILAGGDDSLVRFWDATTGRPLPSLTGHEGVILDIAFSADGSLLATTDGSGAGVKIWSPGRATVVPEAARPR